MAKIPHEPELGSTEHAMITTIRTYRQDLENITDEPVYDTTINAMVARMRDYDKQTEPITKEMGSRIRELEARWEPLPKNDPQRAKLEKQLVAVDREWDRRRAPLSKALHKDLDTIVSNAVKPYVERQRALVKSVNAVGKNLRSRALADAFKARQQSHRQHQQKQPAKDNERER